jgi:hypothetical protein
MMVFDLACVDDVGNYMVKLINECNFIIVNFRTIDLKILKVVVF